ncbi:MAG: tape measure protein [Saprospiraceae bacterium]|nr:tape measure protein [Saprospiraceae bacterium]
MARTIGDVTIRIGANIRQLEYQLKKAERAVMVTSERFKSMGQNLTFGVSAPILALGATSLRAAGNIQALQKGLSSVMGSAELAAIEFEKLKEVAKLPGLGLEEAARGSVQLQAAGFSADEARRSLLAFGNALATVGKGKNELNFVNLALSQLQNKTGGFGQDLRQLTEQLPQLRGALTNAFGTADSEKIQELGVTGKQVVQVLIQEFEKLPKVTGGLNNAFENFSDSLKIALFTIGDSLNKAFGVESLLDVIGKKLIGLADAFSKLNPFTQKAIFYIVGLAAAIGPLLYVFGSLYSVVQLTRIAMIKFTATSGLITFLKLATASTTGFKVAMDVLKTSILTTLKAALLNPYVLAIAATAAVYLLYKNWEKVGNYFIEIYNNSLKLRAGIQAIVFVAKTLYETIVFLGKSLVDLFNLDFSEIKKNFNDFKDNTLKNLHTGFKNTFDPEPIKKFGSDVKNVFSDISKLKGLESIKSPKQEGYTPIGILAPAAETIEINTDSAKEKVKTLNEQITALKENIEQLSIKYAVNPSSGLLQTINKQIDVLKSKEAILENAVHLTERLSNPVSGEISILPRTNDFAGALQTIQGYVDSFTQTVKEKLTNSLTPKVNKTAFELFSKDLQTQLDNIEISSDFDFNIKSDKIDFLKGKLQELRKNGFSPVSKEVETIKDKLSELGVSDGFLELERAVGQINKSLAKAGEVVGLVSGAFTDFANSQIAKIDAKEKREIEAINNSTLNEELKNKKISEVEAKYDKERKRVQRKQAIANKLTGIFNATVSMFEGIAKALTLGPAGLPLIPLLKGLGLAQIAAIASAPLPSLAIGTDYVKSDGLAQLHKGEAVVPADVVNGGFTGGRGRLEILLSGSLLGNDIYLSNKQTEYDKTRTA